MPPAGSKSEVICSETAEDLKVALRDYLRPIIIKALMYPGLIAIGVSGGSMPKILAGVLPLIEGVNWKRVKFFFVDERVVPHTNADSNYGAYLDALPSNFHECLLPVDMCETIYRSDRSTFPYDVPRTALSYEAALKQVIGPEMIGRLPRFDIILLGVGPDGHTASLFPHSKLWKSESYSWLHAVDDSPKPPLRRVTITMPVINHGKNVAFIITGEEKASVVKAILEKDPALPASHVKPVYGALKFFLDQKAASKLDAAMISKHVPQRAAASGETASMDTS